MASDILRCKAVGERIAYLKNRMKWIISKAEFGEIKVSEEEINLWEAEVSELTRLEALCKDGRPQADVPFTSAEIMKYRLLDEKISKLLDMYED